FGILLQGLPRRFVEIERVVVEVDVVQRSGVALGAVLALLCQRQTAAGGAGAERLLAVAGFALLAVDAGALLLRRATERDEHGKHHRQPNDPPVHRLYLIREEPRASATPTNPTTPERYHRPHQWSIQLDSFQRDPRDIFSLCHRAWS